MWLIIIGGVILGLAEEWSTLFVNADWQLVVGFGVLIVTLLVEAPISRRVKVWTMGTLPDNWQQLRDRWGTFHIVRVVASVAGLGLLVGGAIF